MGHLPAVPSLRSIFFTILQGKFTSFFASLSQTSFVLTSFPLVLVPSLLTLPFFSSEVVLGGCWAHNLLFAGPLSFRFPRTLHLFLLGARAWLEPEKAVTGNQKM